MNEEITIIKVYNTNDDYNFKYNFKGLENGEKLKVLGMVMMMKREIMKYIDFSMEDID